MSRAPAIQIDRDDVTLDSEPGSVPGLADLAAEIRGLTRDVRANTAAVSTLSTTVAVEVRRFTRETRRFVAVGVLGAYLVGVVGFVVLAGWQGMPPATTAALSVLGIGGGALLYAVATGGRFTFRAGGSELAVADDTPSSK